MPRHSVLPVLVLSFVAAVAFAACSSGGAPTWTYAPAPSPSAAASGAASGGPSAGASAAPSSAGSAAPSVAPSAGGSAAPSGGASAAPSGGAAGLTVSAPVGASTAGFDPKELETAAGTAFALTFDNQDNQAPHNLVLQKPDGSAVAVQGDTAFFTGPGERTYQVPALTAGDYSYVCQVHPTTMLGKLTVK
ncbi:MAG TPA: cupredoxin domain-containing protein [Methylomirabilota bacterium]|nr:cupredoxin domain-containing protein [Methylomirabilota bacterium]